MNVIINLFKNITKTNVFSNFLNLSIIQVSNILLMILIYPILTRIVGLENFGKIMVANASAGLLGILVNYGTIQTSISDVAALKENKQLLSKIFCNTITIRVLIFLIVALLLLTSYPLIKDSYILHVLSLPIVIAEVLNPMFFFLGVEKLKYINLANLFAKIITLILLLILIEGGKDYVWVNFIMGSILSITYIIAIIWVFKKYKLYFIIPTRVNQILILRGNFYLLVNNFAVHLQQSIMLFALQGIGNAIWLGAYALCDKVVWSSRLLIISISSAIYPKSTRIYLEGPKAWMFFKRKSKYVFGSVFLIGSILIFLSTDIIVEILAGKENINASLFLRQMAFAPFLASLNSMNILDRLVAKDLKSIFNIACILTILSFLCSFILSFYTLNNFFGFYVVIMELSAFLLYEYYIEKMNKL